MHRRVWLGALVSVGLCLISSAASAFSVGNAFDRIAAYRRNETLAPLVTALGAENDEISAVQAALQALPTDIPGSRLQSLQAPLRARVDEARHRRDEFEARMRAASASTDTDDWARRVFECIALSEPWIYAMLALVGVTAPAAPSSGADYQAAYFKGRRGRSGDGSNQDARTRRRGPFAGIATGLVLAFAPHADVRTAAPNAGPLVAADAAPPPKPKSGRSVVPRVSQRGEPRWLTRATALRATGQSYRAIARAINVPKSTVARWLTSGALD